MVADEQQTQALTAVPANGTLPLSYARDADKPERVDLLSRSYRSDAPGLTVRFGFDLTNPVHAAELLLIGRRGEICVDVLKEIADSNDPRGDCLDILSVTATPESARSLIAVASSVLRDLVPTDRKLGKPGADWGSCGDGPWSHEGLCYDTLMSALELVTADSDANAGEIRWISKAPWFRKAPHSAGFVGASRTIQSRIRLRPTQPGVSADGQDRIHRQAGRRPSGRAVDNGCAFPKRGTRPCRNAASS